MFLYKKFKIEVATMKQFILNITEDVCVFLPSEKTGSNFIWFRNKSSS